MRVVTQHERDAGSCDVVDFPSYTFVRSLATVEGSGRSCSTVMSGFRLFVWVALAIFPPCAFEGFLLLLIPSRSLLGTHRLAL
jgi:hypothetical protein